MLKFQGFYGIPVDQTYKTLPIQIVKIVTGIRVFFTISSQKIQKYYTIHAARFDILDYGKGRTRAAYGKLKGANDVRIF